MNKEHRGILIGMVLGDGYLTPITKNSSSLSLHHSIKQKEWIEYKARLLHSILGGIAPNIREKEYNGFLSLQTSKSDSYFRILRKWIYKSNKKTFSRKILDRLTDQGVAIWWMDDGSLTLSRYNGHISSRRGTLSTFCSLEEAVIIKDWFWEKYQIHCGISKTKSKVSDEYLYSIRFNSRNMVRLVEVISPYIIPSMQYKVDLQYEEPKPTIDPRNLIGELILRIRERKGWTQQQLANYVGIKSWQTVSLWENGKRLPGKASLEEIYRLGQECMISLSTEIKI